MLLDRALLIECSRAFASLEASGRKTAYAIELKDIIIGILGRQATNDHCFRLMAEIEDDCRGKIGMARTFEKHAATAAEEEDERGIEATWRWLGGSNDKTGSAKFEKVLNYLKSHLGLPFDDDHLKEIFSVSKSGDITFTAFSSIYR